jgi:hypothetical protein
MSTGTDMIDENGVLKPHKTYVFTYVACITTGLKALVQFSYPFFCFSGIKANTPTYVLKNLIEFIILHGYNSMSLFYFLILVSLPLELTSCEVKYYFKLRQRKYFLHNYFFEKYL